MLNPTINSRVLDPACGSGGFIVMVLDHVRKQITKNMFSELEGALLEAKANSDAVNVKVKEYAENMIFGFDFDPDLKKAAKMNMVIIIRKTKCFDFWERNVLFPKTKRSFFRTPKHPLPCPFPLNFSLLIITKKFGNLAKNRYICIV